MACGKNPRTTRFNNSFTPDPRSRGKPQPGMIPATFRLFNIFPTPYYGYYNKFNIHQAVLHPDPWAKHLKTGIQTKERQ